MTAAQPLTLWIADQVRNELAPRSYPVVTQRGVNRFCKGVVKGGGRDGGGMV